MSERVTVERDDKVLLIGINRPEKRNAFDLATIAALGAAYEKLGKDPEIRAGVVFGHGDHFSAGLDLAEVGPVVAAQGAGCAGRRLRVRPIRIVGSAGAQTGRHGGERHRFHAFDRARAGQRHRRRGRRRPLPPARNRARHPPFRRRDDARTREARLGQCHALSLDRRRVRRGRSAAHRPRAGGRRRTANTSSGRAPSPSSSPSRRRSAYRAPSPTRASPQSRAPPRPPRT